MRPPGSPKQLEKRRLYAIKLRQAGKSLTEVARWTGVDRRSIARWQKIYRAKGSDGLQARSIPGRPIKLSRRQLQQLRRLLLKGSLAHGFPTDYWTLQRARALIWKYFRVHYTPSAIWYLLARFEWSCQKPQPYSILRDESKIAHWKRYVWPQIKKTHGNVAHTLFL
jgi:transposase